MKKGIYGIYGAGGFGREVIPVARAQLLRAGVAVEKLVFVDDNPPIGLLNGYHVLTYQDFLNIDSSSHYVVVAIADGNIRQKVVERISADGVLKRNRGQTITFTYPSF